MFEKAIKMKLRTRERFSQSKFIVHPVGRVVIMFALYPCELPGYGIWKITNRTKYPLLQIETEALERLMPFHI